MKRGIKCTLIMATLQFWSNIWMTMLAHSLIFACFTNIALSFIFPQECGIRHLSPENFQESSRFYYLTPVKDLTKVFQFQQNCFSNLT